MVTTTGPRIAEASGEEEMTEPLFVNIVSHPAVERPALSSTPSLSSSSSAPVLVNEQQEWAGA
jgi:hypothetical protein